MTNRFKAAWIGALLLLVPLAPATAELPAPELTAAVPADQAELAGPVTQVSLTFASAVDLVSVVVVTPDQRKLVLHDAADGGEERKGDRFTLTLPQPVAMEGTYLVEISASVSDPRDSSASSLSTMTSFVIAKAPAPAGS